MSTATASPKFTAEFAIGYRGFMLASLENEVEITKKVLAAAGAGKKDYRPDPKSRTLWELATHIAAWDVQLAEDIAALKFNMEQTHNGPWNTGEELVAWYDKSMNAALAEVRAMTPEQLLTPVDFFGMFNFPAFMYLNFVNNHGIHHRGQLSSYLRAAGSKVPSIYGGSADEPMM